VTYTTSNVGFVLHICSDINACAKMRIVRYTLFKTQLACENISIKVHGAWKLIPKPHSRDNTKGSNTFNAKALSTVNIGGANTPNTDCGS